MNGDLTDFFKEHNLYDKNMFDYFKKHIIRYNYQQAYLLIVFQ